MTRERTVLQDVGSHFFSSARRRVLAIVSFGMGLLNSYNKRLDIQQEFHYLRIEKEIKLADDMSTYFIKNYEVVLKL